MKNRLSVIQCHSQQSILCALVAAAHILKRTPEVVLLIPVSISLKTLDELRFPPGVRAANLEDSAFCGMVVQARTVEYVAWYHERGIPLAIEFAALLNRTNSNCELVLSFLPDGFVNVYGGSYIPNRILDGIENGASKFGPAYLFFSNNQLSRSNVKWTDVQVLCESDYHVALEVYRSLVDRSGLIDRLLRAINKLRVDSLILVLIRPWCSGFHGGKYKFGEGSETLAHIYRNVVEKIAAGDRESLSSLVVIRGDDRYGHFQQQVVSHLLGHYGEMAYDMSMEIPPMVTSEVFLYYIFEGLPAELMFTVVSLDSMAPFPVLALGHDVKCIMGASSKELVRLGAARENLNYIEKNLQARYATIDDYVCESRRLSCAVEKGDGYIVLDAKTGPSTTM